MEKVKDALTHIRAILKETPIIFTFRSAKEGGEREIGLEYYIELNKAIIETGNADMIDIELFNEEKVIQILVEKA
ncbi:type I 3-dehydroquinate dehydratase, partial [Alkalihalophilus lindianensis]